MPILEKELSEALVHYRFEKHLGVDTVDVERTRTLLRKWHDREHEVDRTAPILGKIGEMQAEAGRATSTTIEAHIAILQHWLDREMRRRWDEEAQVLEGTDEFNRAHKEAMT